MVEGLTPEGAELVAAQASTATLRQELHPSVVLTQYGHEPVRDNGKVLYRQSRSVHKRLSYINPFRDDKHPSLDVFRWGDEWKLGDMAENWQGSVLDLIIRLEDCKLQRAIDVAKHCYAIQLSQGIKHKMSTDSQPKGYEWPNPKHDEQVSENWHHFYSEAHPSLPPLAWLREHFGVVITANETVWCPYFDGLEVVGHKELSRLRGKILGLESRVALYGTTDSLSRLRNTSLTVIICEGESDTWIMEYLFGDMFVVVGFPGANQNIDHLLSELEWPGRSVVLAFDGDAVGTSGRQEVAAWLKEHEAEVTVIPMPDGQDPADMDEDSIRELFDAWQMPFGLRQHIGQFGSAYRRLNADGESGQALSNWSIDIERLLIGDEHEDYAYEGWLRPNNRRVTLTSQDLRSQQRLINWASNNAVQWMGRADDVQKLSSLLHQQATFVPVGRMTNRVGLHKGEFVWPSGYIGLQPWSYVPGEQGLKLQDQIYMQPQTDEQAMSVLWVLTQMHRPEVVMPILSWLAAAPFRTLFKFFPVLHITGSSGSGKTTLTQVLTYQFSGSMITSNLTATTPYSIASHFASSNGFPVWFDEYRPGARTDTKLALDQLLRDCYTGQVSTRGGVGAGSMAKIIETKTDTPVIVTGEDVLTEKSHLDRSIMLTLPKDGKNPEALSKTDFMSPLSHHFLTWAHRNNIMAAAQEPLRDLEVDMTKLSDRQQQNLKVLDRGYAILRRYANDHNQDIPEKNWQMVMSEAEFAADHDPVVDLLFWALEESKTDAIKEYGPYLYISPLELMREALKPGGPPLQLPFTTHVALTKWLSENMDGAVKRVAFGEKSKKVVQIKKEHVVEDDDLVFDKEDTNVRSTYEMDTRDRSDPGGGGEPQGHLEGLHDDP